MSQRLLVSVNDLAKGPVHAAKVTDLAVAEPAIRAALTYVTAVELAEDTPAANDYWVTRHARPIKHDLGEHGVLDVVVGSLRITAEVPQS